MRELTPIRDWVAMKDNIRRAVLSLEVCWKCQRVTECEKYVLGNMVLVWLCPGCLEEMEDRYPEQVRQKSRAARSSRT